MDKTDAAIGRFVEELDFGVFGVGFTASLLIVGGGIDALRSSAIITGFPFAVVSVVAIAGMALEFQRVDPLLSDGDSLTASEDAGSSERAVPSDDD